MSLVETELAARDASNVVNRLKAAAFPVPKTLESFDVAASSIQPKVFDYLSSLEWIRAQQNLAIVGPPGTGKSHLLVGCGHAAVHAGFKVRYFTAADLIEVIVAEYAALGDAGEADRHQPEWTDAGGIILIHRPGDRPGVHRRVAARRWDGDGTRGARVPIGADTDGL